MTTELVKLIGNPHFWMLVGIYWVFSAAVGALEKPTDKSGSFYRWAFQFLNTLAGNLSRAFASKIPGV
jgi:hypothetical protein